MNNLKSISKGGNDMQELIKIENKPAVLTINFNELKTRLASELERYDVVVTEDTVADAKKLATELNQTARFIDDRRKQEVAAVSEPIRKFDDQMKELVSMCKDGRQKLLDQIKVYEDETREKARQLIVAFTDEQWDALGVEKEFRNVRIDDLVMLTAVTKAGNLAAKTSNEITARVQANRALQDRTHMRLLKLENISYEQGLSAPLTRDHVAGFLFAEDDVYDAEIHRIIEAEKKREEIAQQRMRERMEREEQQLKDREERAPEQKPIDYPPVEEELRIVEDAPDNENTEPEDGKVAVTITATFSLIVDQGVSLDAVAMAFRKRMKDDGYTTLTGVEVRGNPVMAA